MKQRPLAATILAILAVIAGIVAVIDALRYFRILPAGALGELNFFTFAPFAGILALVVAAIWFSTARQLLNLDPRGWMFVVVIAIIALVINVLALLGGSTFNSIFLSFIAPILALILAFLPGTKAAFGQKA